jgi:hypothetical protein
MLLGQNLWGVSGRRQLPADVRSQGRLELLLQHRRHQEQEEQLPEDCVCGSHGGRG